MGLTGIQADPSHQTETIITQTKKDLMTGTEDKELKIRRIRALEDLHLKRDKHPDLAVMAQDLTLTQILEEHLGIGRTIVRYAC